MKLWSLALTAQRHLSSYVAAYRHMGSRSSCFQQNVRSFSFSLKKKKSGRGSKTSGTAVPWTDEQKQVLDAVGKGKSIFITGSAGTGKTFLLEQIIKTVQKIHGGSGVYVTASTGIAACELEGQTLHSFAGVGYGELDREGLLERVLLDHSACLRWRKAKVLIVDEISMVGAELFENLAYIARRVREEFEGECDSKTWGGIQLIVSGDFFQLPPILKEKDTKKKSTKVYAFEADCWSSSFDLQIELTTVFRQSDTLLVQLLQSIRKGDKKCIKLKLLEQCRSEPDPSDVRLYPRRQDVQEVNMEKLERLNEDIYTYKAEDSGEEKWRRQLQSGIAPDELKICVGARVMLIRNLNPSEKLVNGSTGTIVGFFLYGGKDDGMCNRGNALPVVQFDSGPQLVVDPETWSVMDGEKVVAWRRQIPLILAWALSIHKCQGMSLDKLHTDLSRAFEYGMVYVALSRVRSLKGLHLSGLKRCNIRAHPKVLGFYDSFACQEEEEEGQLQVKVKSTKPLARPK